MIKVMMWMEMMIMLMDDKSDDVDGDGDHVDG